MSHEIDEVIEIFLTEARSAIEHGGTWSPLVHILHPKGKSMRISRMSADPREEGRIASPISSKMKELNAIVAIIITNNSVADETWENPVHRTMQTLFPGWAEALAVEMWWRDGGVTCGLQMYRRCPDGKVVFEDLKWLEPR